MEGTVVNLPNMTVIDFPRAMIWLMENYPDVLFEAGESPSTLYPETSIMRMIDDYQCGRYHNVFHDKVRGSTFMVIHDPDAALHFKLIWGGK